MTDYMSEQFEKLFNQYQAMLDKLSALEAEVKNLNEKLAYLQDSQDDEDYDIEAEDEYHSFFGKLRGTASIIPPEQDSLWRE